ncbi:hypothetical protein Hanom_Chr03g00211951 [Helianthus anomalus]
MKTRSVGPRLRAPDRDKNYRSETGTTDHHLPRGFFLSLLDLHLSVSLSSAVRHHAPPRATVPLSLSSHCRPPPLSVPMPHHHRTWWWSVPFSEAGGLEPPPDRSSTSFTGRRGRGVLCRPVGLNSGHRSSYREGEVKGEGVWLCVRDEMLVCL